MPEDNYYLIAFGNIEGANTKIPADSVFDRLFDAGLWYTTRPSRVLEPGGYVMFYQNGAGFRGYAKITGIDDSASEAPFGHDPYFTFSQRISLGDAERFAEPIDPRPLVASLDFISTKIQWGHAFRSTPRKISKKDYLTILHSTGRKG